MVSELKSLVTRQSSSSRIQRQFVGGLCLAALLCGASVLVGGNAWGAGGDLLWEVATGGAIAASNGRVVVAGSAGVQTFEGSSGTLLWRDSFFGATTVAMDAQQVIAVGANAIRAYDAKNGSLDWQAPLASGTALRAAELRGNQLLVVGSAMDSLGAIQLLIRAYDVRNGQIDWEDQSQPPDASLASFFSPTKKAVTVHGNRVYAVATVIRQASGSQPFCLVRAYDRIRGNLVWESVSQNVCVARAVEAHGQQVILAGIGGTGVDDFLVRSYDAQTGGLLWEDRTFVPTGFDNQAVAVDDEGKRAFVAGWVNYLNRPPGTLTRDAFLVRAYNMKTGERCWEDQYPGSGEACRCRANDIAAEGGRVFAVGIVPFIVRAYDARSGNLLWQNELPTGRTESIVVDRGIVFAADSGVLRAYEAK